MTFEKGRKKIWASVVLRSFSQMAFYSAKGSLIRGWNSKRVFLERVVSELLCPCPYGGDYFISSTEMTNCYLPICNL